MNDGTPQYPRGLCDACLREATGRTPGNIRWSLPGFGLLFFGKSEKCPNCSSVVRILCVTVLFIPLFPLKTYRYLQIEGNSLWGRFIARRTHTRSKTLVTLWRIVAVSVFVFLPARKAVHQATPNVPAYSPTISQPPSPKGVSAHAPTPAGPWEYRSEEHGFSLTLPSSDWTQSANASAILHFSSNGWEVTVSSVKRETAEDLRATIPMLKADLETMIKPEFQESTTDVGNYYLFSAYLQSAPSYSQAAQCRAWLKRDGITVRVQFQGEAQRTTPQKYADFKQLAKSICLSVK